MMRAPTVRPPAVAGLFYPEGRDALARMVDGYLADEPATASLTHPKALVAPHAGYIYSGSIAAHAYRLLAPLRGKIERVVLLGPAHRVYVEGLALPEAGRFATPLGEVELDCHGIDAIAGMKQVVVSGQAHAHEHSLEVHLPFLQRTLGSFRLVPLVVGQATPEQVAQVIETLWGGPETLIVVSSDLSHFMTYEDARRIDASTCRVILALEPRLDPMQACGAMPINGLLLAARRHGLVPELLDLRNSGDTEGDPDRVVGYAAVAFYEPGIHERSYGHEH
jgi:AmmeMemoRadiSam system protein B